MASGQSITVKASHMGRRNSINYLGTSAYIQFSKRVSRLLLTNDMIQAITDIPCIMFVDELIAAYPNAKVVLTNRDPDKWLVSILGTIYVILSWDWERWAIPYVLVRPFPLPPVQTALTKESMPCRNPSATSRSATTSSACA
jgi:hypothetical protein